MHAYVDLLKLMIKQGKIPNHNPNNNDIQYNTNDGILFSFDNKYTLDVMVLPSAIVANRCKEFITSNSNSNSNIPIDLLEQYQLIRIVPLNFEDIQVVYFPTSLSSSAKAFWQHIGEILSSRKAEAALRSFGFAIPNVTELYSSKRECLSDSYSADSSSPNPYQIIKERIMTIVHEPLNDNSITITTSGMAAIYTSLKLIRRVLGEEYKGCDLEIVVFGFPYLDTLKMMQRTELNPGGYHFFGNGSESDIDALEQLLIDRDSTNSSSSSNGNSNKKIGGVFTEFPTNPLLKAPNLKRLHSLSKRYGFLLVVDDTIGNFANLDLLHHSDVKVDILCTSLTKIFSGRGDVMAGSLVVNSLGPYYDKLRDALPHLHPEPLYLDDALVLEINSRDFVERSKRIMKSAAALALWLCGREEVEYVYYPHPDVINIQKGKERGKERAVTIDPPSVYPSLLKSNSTHNNNNINNNNNNNNNNDDDDGYGYGCLLSIILKDDYDEKKFFDALDFNKGPSLGTNCTLVCPYTLLAHYTELDWAASYGVDRRLVRVSVGLEDIQQILLNFDFALKASYGFASSL